MISSASRQLYRHLTCDEINRLRFMSDRISRRSSAACRRRAPNWNRRSAPTDWWPAPPARAPRRSQRPARPTRPPRRRPPSNSRWTLATLAASTDTPVTIAHFDSPGFHITWWRATLETHTHTHTLTERTDGLIHVSLLVLGSLASCLARVFPPRSI